VHSFSIQSAAWAACCLLAGTAYAADPAPVAQLSWTSLGVPHIQASDDHGLGEGIGYAYARDNLCLLEDEVLTASGERARYLGRAGTSSSGLDNLTSDIFFQWLNGPEAVQAFWRAQPPAMQQRIAGYVAGVNRYLVQTPSAQQPEQCRNAGWLRPLANDDVIRLVRRMLVEGGAGRFAKALVAAAPPGAAGPQAANPQAVAQALAQLQTFANTRGSNAIAVGGARSDNGKGLLLGNPHFPWTGGLRFYQMHLTIPGQLDVMGAALPGLPLVNIGFNQHLAWTHTVDQSSHFTLHRLTLTDAGKAYLVDGQPQALKKQTFTVRVREADGSLATVNHDVYRSRFGPLVMLPGLMPWDASHAYALQDANLGNDRILAQWDAMNRATSVKQLQQVVADHQGIPWVNTLAVDDTGQSLYMNASVVPNIPLAQLAQCADPALVKAGLPGVDGSRGACDWQNDEGAQQPGIVAARHLPQLLRNDVLQNSNDSAWMTQPAAPLVGFSPLISRSDRPLGLRARFALDQLQRLGSQAVTPAFLQSLVTGNRVYLADLVLDDVLAFCGAHDDATTASACAALKAWDRRAQLDSGLGMLYFQLTLAGLQTGQDWRVPFSPTDPVHTPAGIAWQNPDVAARLKQALATASAQVAKAGLAADTRWGQLQGVQRGGQRIAIPGGDGKLGVYDAMTTRRHGLQLDVDGGSSYIQLVGFDANGPVARGLLAFSQSSNPASPHFKDQTLLFSAQQWQPLPFTPAQMAADGEHEVLQLR